MYLNGSSKKCTKEAGHCKNISNFRRVCILLTVGLSSMIYLTGRHSNGRVEIKQHGTHPQPRCESKITRIGFVKVHKAASTTFTSILQRFGLANHLSFALPRYTDWNINLYGSINKRNVLPMKDGRSFDILCQHVVYNRTAFRKYLPTDMTLVTSVREPFQRFVSTLMFFPEYRAAIYARHKGISNTKLMIRLFLEHPEKYEPRKFKRGSLALNRMAYDLGIPPSQFHNSSYVSNYIQQLDMDFFFVIVREYFDESLVILKRRMCWSTKDILYQWRYKRKPQTWTDEELVKLHKKLCPAEYQIYNYFLQKLVNILKSQEPDFLEETRLFKARLLTVQRFCFQKKSVEPLVFLKSKFDSEFNFTIEDCYYLKMHEISFVKYLKRLQKREIKGN